VQHRQYVFSSGFRTVVVIADDRHAGQAIGSVAVAVDDDRLVAPFQNSCDFTATPTQRGAARLQSCIPHAKGFGEGWAGMT
jgi:hypothetical protein